MPSSSLVEIEVEIEVELGVEVCVGVEVQVGVEVGSRCSSVFLLFRVGGWVGGCGGWRSQI